MWSQNFCAHAQALASSYNHFCLLSLPTFQTLLTALRYRQYGTLRVPPCSACTCNNIPIWHYTSGFVHYSLLDAYTGEAYMVVLFRLVILLWKTLRCYVSTRIVLCHYTNYLSFLTALINFVIIIMFSFLWLWINWYRVSCVVICWCVWIKE